MVLDLNRTAVSRQYWQRLIYRYERSRRRALAGGTPQARRWFAQSGSMTQQLRVTGALKLEVEWFQARRVGLAPAWVRHTFLRTPNTMVEAWVWISWSGRFQERQWFESTVQPIGDVLFQRNQVRQFSFFRLPGDGRVFRHSHLLSPLGARVDLIEAWGS